MLYVTVGQSGWYQILLRIESGFLEESSTFWSFHVCDLENTLDHNPSCTFCQHWRESPRLASAKHSDTELHLEPCSFLQCYCCTILQEVWQVIDSWLLQFHSLCDFSYSMSKNGFLSCHLRTMPKMTRRKVPTTNTISTPLCRTKQITWPSQSKEDGITNL